jgi:hypothetical protein
MDTVPQNSTPVFSSTALLNYYGLINDLSTVVVPAWLMLWASSQMRSLIHREWDRASSRSRLCCCCCRWHKVGPLGGGGGRINNKLLDSTIIPPEAVRVAAAKEVVFGQ